MYLHINPFLKDVDPTVVELTYCSLSSKLHWGQLHSSTGEIKKSSAPTRNMVNFLAKSSITPEMIDQFTYGRRGNETFLPLIRESGHTRMVLLTHAQRDTVSHCSLSILDSHKRGKGSIVSISMRQDGKADVSLANQYLNESQRQYLVELQTYYDAKDDVWCKDHIEEIGKEEFHPVLLFASQIVEDLM